MNQLWQIPADILVIDDDRLFLEIVSDSLKKEGHVVEKVNSGKKAIEMIDSRDFDVVVSDLVMPEIDGQQILSHVQAQSTDTEVIILTGKADLDSAIGCLRLGAFDIVRKENEMPQLEAAVNRAIERRILRSKSDLHEVSRLIFACEDRMDLPERIVNVATQVMDADDASLMLVDINGELYITYSNGLPEHMQLSQRILIGDGVAGRIASERKPTIIQGALPQEQRFSDDLIALREVLSSIVFPLVSGDTLLGVLNLNRLSAQKKPFRPADISRAELLASQIVLALENQQLIRRVTAADKFTAVGQLSTAIAHEINNPITFVLGGVTEVLDIIREAEQKATTSTVDEENHPLALLGGARGIRELTDMLEDSYDGAIRIRDVIRDLRSIVRDDHSTKEPFDLNGSIQAALRICMAELRSVAKIQLNLGTDVILEGSRGAMSQVFINLFVNAVHAMRDAGQSSGRLTIESRNQNGRIEVRVRDTGPGIPSEQLARIFEPFFTTKPVGNGTGLGLPTCRDIVNWHGGNMQVRSRVGRGTSFIITLPAFSSRNDEKMSPGVQNVGCRPAEVEGLKVLVVDDEVAICRTLSRMLKKNFLTMLHDGQQAYELLSTNQSYDVILCDVVMPGLTGVELYTKMLQANSQQLENFVFITGSSGYANVKNFASEHKIPVMEKPIDRGLLHQLIGKLLTKQKSSS